MGEAIYLPCEQLGRVQAEIRSDETTHSTTQVGILLQSAWLICNLEKANRFVQITEPHSKNHSKGAKIPLFRNLKCVVYRPRFPTVSHEFPLTH